MSNFLANATRVGRIMVGGKAYTGKEHVRYQHALVCDWDNNFPNELRRRHVSLVYIFVVDGVIKKIGQSSCGTGISGCLAFYMKAGQDNPGPNRFSINHLIRSELEKERNVEVYMIYMEPITISMPSLTGERQVVVPVSAKGIEDNCLEEYRSFHQGRNPDWNFQENGESIPQNITDDYNEYRTLRAAGSAKNV